MLVVLFYGLNYFRLTGHAYGVVLWTELFSVDGWGGLTLYILTLGLYVRGPRDYPLASSTAGRTEIGQGQGLRHLFIVVRFWEAYVRARLVQV